MVMFATPVEIMQKGHVIFVEGGMIAHQQLHFNASHVACPFVIRVRRVLEMGGLLLACLNI
jgi:hypothetical protein